MAVETAFVIVNGLLQLNPFLLLGGIVLVSFVAFKIFQTLYRMLITGIAFGAFPFIANFLGIPVPLTLQSVLWSIILGIATYIAYMGISFTFKVMNFVFSPFKKGYSKKEKK